MEMKVQNMIRMQVIAAGFAAALFLASAAPAQEISNTEWRDGQDVVTPAQMATAQAANQANGAAQVQATNNDATANAPAANQKATIAQQLPIEDSWMTTFLVISFALLTLYALAGTRRANRNRYARADAFRSASLS
jgi:hypothetical protein